MHSKIRSSLIFMIFIFVKYSSCQLFDIREISLNMMTRLPPNLTFALKDIAEGLPSNSITIVIGNSTSLRVEDVNELHYVLNSNNIQITTIDLYEEGNRKIYFDYLMKAMDSSLQRTSVILCEPYECEHFLAELVENNIIHRSLLYMFYWHYGEVSQEFLQAITEAIRVAVITNPRPNVFRVYYNQASPERLNHLSLVNWWSGALYKSPLLPPPAQVYHNFRGRLFNIPVLHAPPWHFVNFNNDSSIEVTGGRDEKLLSLLAEKLNFRYQYYDPPERSQGSGINANGTFKGILGLIWKRKADFFLGDVTMTWERLQGVEFSFLTLADSGAFVTHAPSKLNEALALIRPFRWEVWPLVVCTLVAAGPALWAVVAAPSLWRGRADHSQQLQLLGRCCWYTTTLFLRQPSGKEPSSTHKARLVAIAVSLCATYVIGDVYSANLTSLMARPAREPPVGTLASLEDAMTNRGYELVVERHSSTLAILQNGTGVYGRLARLMRRQRVQRVRSVERGIRLVLRHRTVAVLGGRETLYFDTKRFGAQNFHLSEKLYTRYSAIALQNGCPYLENFNLVLMQVFEAGILTKMTLEEYERLGERKTDAVGEGAGGGGSAGGGGVEAAGLDSAGDAGETPAQPERKLEPVSLRMLRGAFCLLGIGHLLSGLVLVCELEKARAAARRPLVVERKRREARCYRKQRRLHTFANAARGLLRRVAGRTVRALHSALNDSTLSLDYIE